MIINIQLEYNTNQCKDARALKEPEGCRVDAPGDGCGVALKGQYLHITSAFGGLFENKGLVRGGARSRVLELTPAGFSVFLSDLDPGSKIWEIWSHFSISAIAGVCVVIS